MTDIRPGTSTQSQFFNQKNEVMLDRLLYTDFQRRLGGELTDKQKERLNKTVKHYMTEIYAKNSGESIQFLNKEVLTSVVPDYMGYLRRSSGPVSAAENATENNGLRLDVNSRFDQIQSERQERRAGPPPPPDFQISLDEAGPTPLSQFELIKKQREAEAARETELITSRSTVLSQEIVVAQMPDGQSPMGRFVDSDTDFRSSSEASRQRDQLSLIMREAERISGNSAARTEMVDLPDPRRLLLGNSPTMTLPPRSQGIPNGNPTTALPERMPQRVPLPQDVLKAQDDIVAYKEVEHNLYVYSADRNWVSNTAENRYNFSVTFDPANNQSGFGNTTATNVKFKNIVRIEFVKAIMPTESFDVLPTTTSALGGVYVNTLNTNILSFPYLQVRIPELNVNGYGTNDGMNNAFAAISYDAYWTSDANAANRGYARMIPKFLKCQKVYYPTPLATLQKLTFEIQRPDGSYVSNTKDTLDVAYVYMPAASATGTTIYKGNAGGAVYEWIWIATSTYFNKFMFTQGDRIVFKNIAFNATLTAVGANATSLSTFLTREEGHLIANIGIVTGAATPTFSDDGNRLGYANGIVIRNSFPDPTTGAVTLDTWASSLGGSSVFANNPSTTTGRLINMNHQIQIIMRVITREMDSAAKLRPDNLQA
jgi:hypothetical protein